MSLETEQRLADWAVWFHENRKHISPGNLEKQNLFLLKAVDGCLECLAMALKDIQILERRNGSAGLWLPPRIKNGQTTRFEQT